MRVSCEKRPMESRLRMGVHLLQEQCEVSSGLRVKGMRKTRHLETRTSFVQIINPGKAIRIALHSSHQIFPVVRMNAAQERKVLRTNR
jgi:hypothetical protein